MKSILSIIALFSLSVVAFAQERVPVPPDPLPSAKAMDYVTGHAVALAANKPLLAFVGCEPSACGCDVCECKECGCFVAKIADAPGFAPGSAFIMVPSGNTMAWAATIEKPTPTSVRAALDKCRVVKQSLTTDQVAQSRKMVSDPTVKQFLTVANHIPDATKKVSGDALDEVNAARAARGLRPFARDNGLCAAAASAAEFRARHGIAGHTQNDFAHLPGGCSADAAGCAAWPVGMGWGACCTYESYTHAGAAAVIGADGRRYMHLFVRSGVTASNYSESPNSCPNGQCSPVTATPTRYYVQPTYQRVIIGGQTFQSCPNGNCQNQ